MIEQDQSILLIGLGLIGGSYAQKLTEEGYRVLALDQDPAAITYGLEHGLIQVGATTVEEALAKGFFAESSLVVFGLYPTAMIQWLRQYQQVFAAGAILMDVSGVKCHVVDVIQEELRPDLEFIGCHPMAGRETSGVQNSDAGIFAGANFIVTPTEKNRPETIALAKEFGALLGFANISQLSLAEHDEMIGFLSQLTHAIAVSLMTCNEDENMQKYTGDSFRDLTRIAKINETMWTELFFLNKEILLHHIDDFTAQLQRLKGMLQQEKPEELKALFRQSTARRKAFDR